jgi:DNA-binding MarR family transcriptional regulator
VLRIVSRHPSPMTQTQLRTALKVRNQSLTSALRRLQRDGRIIRANGGWTLPSRTRPQSDAGPLFSQSPI